MRKKWWGEKKWGGGEKNVMRAKIRNLEDLIFKDLTEFKDSKESETLQTNSSPTLRSTDNELTELNKCDKLQEYSNIRHSVHGERKSRDLDLKKRKISQARIQHSRSR